MYFDTLYYFFTLNRARWLGREEDGMSAEILDPAFDRRCDGPVDLYGSLPGSSACAGPVGAGLFPQFAIIRQTTPKILTSSEFSLHSSAELLLLFSQAAAAAAAAGFNLNVWI